MQAPARAEQNSARAQREQKYRPMNAIVQPSVFCPCSHGFIFTLARCESWLQAVRVSSARTSSKSYSRWPHRLDSRRFQRLLRSANQARRTSPRSPIGSAFTSGFARWRGGYAHYFIERNLMRSRISLRGLGCGHRSIAAALLRHERRRNPASPRSRPATGVERFIFASSSSVYGISKTVPFSEEMHITQTISPYAATKVAGEFLCSTYSHLYQMRVVALRFFHRLRGAAAARPGDSSIHEEDSRGRANRSVR